MLVSIQFICIAISLIFGATMLFCSTRDDGWMHFKGGLVRNAMVAFVCFTFLLTLLVSVVLRPY